VLEALHRIVAGLTAHDAIIAVIDIVIVYYAIYRVLLLIKGTRAAQMVIGLVLIGAGFFAATQLELTTVSWLLDNFINYFIIIIIVVFQHDIRRGLVRIGQNLFSFGRTYEETHVFEEVIHAAEHLAKSRIGAIIVFEREGDVAEFVDTGRIIDARVSKELLVALFVPSRDNVLHDGAAVLKNLRVQSAGSVLPLSSNPRLDAELGTRHRAAVGITEETDAVAVVISEERGEMSLCFHGNIARDLDSVTLRKALLGLFYREKGKKRRVAEEAKAAAAAAHGMFAFALRDTKPRAAITDEDIAAANGGDAREPATPSADRASTSHPDLPAQPPRPRTAPPEAG
jgi:diadenylate cyclase